MTSLGESTPMENLALSARPGPSATQFQRSSVPKNQFAEHPQMETNQRTLPAMVPENNIYDVYNNEAWKADIEMVKDWRASLQTLLFFVSPICPSDY